MHIHDDPYFNGVWDKHWKQLKAKGEATVSLFGVLVGVGFVVFLFAVFLLGVLHGMMS